MASGIQSSMIESSHTVSPALSNNAQNGTSAKMDSKPKVSATVSETSSGPVSTKIIHTSRPSGPISKPQAKVQSIQAIQSRENLSSKQFPRISRPVELLKSSYDVVVIGSGYGGSVAASRMARGRQSVCLLELGKERWR